MAKGKIEFSDTTSPSGVMLSGEGIPSPSLGSVGNYYLEDYTATLYLKGNSGWSVYQPNPYKYGFNQILPSTGTTGTAANWFGHGVVLTSSGTYTSAYSATSISNYGSVDVTVAAGNSFGLYTGLIFLPQLRRSGFATLVTIPNNSAQRFFVGFTSANFANLITGGAVNSGVYYNFDTSASMTSIGRIIRSGASVATTTTSVSSPGGNSYWLCLSVNTSDLFVAKIYDVNMNLLDSYTFGASPIPTTTTPLKFGIFCHNNSADPLTLSLSQANFNR